MDMIEEQLKTKALSELQDGIFLSIFHYYMVSTGKIRGTCGEGTCDMDYDDFEKWWEDNKEEYIQMYGEGI